MNFNAKQLAAFLKVSAPQISYWIRVGDLKPLTKINPGRTGYNFDEAEVLAFLDRYQERKTAKIDAWRKLLKAAAFLSVAGEE